ncbi:MAG: hypothetical protein KBB86_00675 [Candidatus Pacebacteria bacterium]|nr:hypothetical protein [Candidatus Paceibacterota bacterium]
MKKLFILFVLLTTLSFQYVSAQCENSPEFLKKLAIYESLLPTENVYSTYEPARLDRLLKTIMAATDVLNSVKTENDYVTLVQVVDFYSKLPVEGRNDLANIDTSNLVIKDFYSHDKEVLDNLNILRQISLANSAYNLQFCNNTFTKNAIIFANSQIKTTSFSMDSTAYVYTKCVLKKDITKYSNYELFVLYEYIGMEFDIFGDFNQKDIDIVVNRLRATNCATYIDLAVQYMNLIE